MADTQNSKTRDKQIGVRVNPDEDVLIQEAAEKAHHPPSKYVRLAALEKARRDLGPKKDSNASSRSMRMASPA